jgi:hypothetical protein
MILKLCRNVTPTGINTGDENEWFDGFDHIEKEDFDWKLRECCPFSCPVHVRIYDENKQQVVKYIILHQKNETIRVLYIDVFYYIYLMDDNGKTIEKIN